MNTKIVLVVYPPQGASAGRQASADKRRFPGRVRRAPGHRGGGARRRGMEGILVWRMNPCLRALALLRQPQGLRGWHSLGELLLALHLGIELGAKEQRDVR